MIVTPRLSLPLLAAGQAQKHVTHNDALSRLDALIQLSVESRSQGAPPAEPEELSAFIVPAGGAGVFAGRENQIALFEDGSWSFLMPRPGWQAWVADEAEHQLWTGSAWRRATPLSSLGAERWGVNATADATNRFAVSSAASLFNHAGGSHRLTLNKAAAAETASVLFQDGWSGRAEFGLAGDDDFRVKVSADGSNWREALTIDRASGAVSLPGSAWATGDNLLLNGDFRLNQRGFAGGSLAAGAYGRDRWKAGPSGAAFTLSGSILTLSSGALVQVVEPELWGLESLAGLALTLSVEATGGALSVGVGDQSAILPGGAGRRVVTLVPATSGPLPVTLAASGSGSITLQRVKLERGPLATGWQARSRSLEELFCRRYHWRPGAGFLLDGYQEAGGALAHSLTLPVPMRVTPTVTFELSQALNIRGSDRGVAGLSPELVQGFVIAQVTGRVRAGFEALAFDAEF